MIINTDFIDNSIVVCINKFIEYSRKEIETMEDILNKTKDFLEEVESTLERWKNERDASGKILNANDVLEEIELRDEIKEEIINIEAKIEFKRATCDLIAVLLDETKLLRARIAQLEKIIDGIPYTLWRVVLAMRAKGMTDKQIAEKLCDKGQGLSKAQIGALLYTGREEHPASKTLQDFGTKLFR